MHDDALAGFVRAAAVPSVRVADFAYNREQNKHAARVCCPVPRGKYQDSCGVLSRFSTEQVMSLDSVPSVVIYR